MAIGAKGVLSALVAAIIGGLAMYGSQFLAAGPSPQSIQGMQVQRELVSTAVLALAAAVGYLAFDGDGYRRSMATVAAVFFLAGLVGYFVGFTALWVAPPEGFTLGSRVLTFTLVILQEVVPFGLAGLVGTAVRSRDQ